MVPPGVRNRLSSGASVTESGPKGRRTSIVNIASVDAATAPGSASSLSSLVTVTVTSTREPLGPGSFTTLRISSLAEVEGSVGVSGSVARMPSGSSTVHPNNTLELAVAVNTAPPAIASPRIRTLRLVERNTVSGSSGTPAEAGGSPSRGTVNGCPSQAVKKSPHAVASKAANPVRISLLRFIS